MQTATAEAQQANGTSPGTALALRQIATPDPYIPRDLSELRLLSKDLHDSKLTKARNPQQVQMQIITGHELGMPPAASTRLVYIADFGDGDVATLAADGMVAVCLSHPEICEYFRCVERSEKGVTYATKRRGNPEDRETFGPEDRDRAKLGKVKDGKDATATNWAKYPVVMMGHRAASILARRVYPDLLGGMYTPDEAAEIAESARTERQVGPAVTPLPTATRAAAPVLDAEIIDTKADAFEAQLRAAASQKDAGPTIKAITEAYPKEDHPQRLRLKAVLKERKDANWAVAAAPPAAAAPASETPAHDTTTGEVREPSEEG